MAKKVVLKDNSGNKCYPVTRENCVLFGDGTLIEKFNSFDKEKLFGFNNNPILLEIKNSSSTVNVSHKIIANDIVCKKGFISFIYIKSKSEGSIEIYKFSKTSNQISNLSSLGTYNINIGENIIVFENPIEISEGSLIGIDNIGIYGSSTSEMSQNIKFISFNKDDLQVTTISNYAVVYSAYIFDLAVASYISQMLKNDNSISNDIMGIKGSTNIKDYENIDFSTKTSGDYLRGFNRVPSSIDGHIYGFRVGLVLNKPTDIISIIPYTCNYDGDTVSEYTEYDKIEQNYIDDKSFYTPISPIPIKKGQYFGLKISNAKGIKWVNDASRNTGFVIPSTDGNGSPASVFLPGIFQEDYFAYTNVPPFYNQLLQLISSIKDVKKMSDDIITKQNEIEESIIDMQSSISEGERGDAEFKHYNISDYPLSNSIKNTRFYGGKQTEKECMLSKIEYNSDNEGTLDIVVVSVDYEALRFEVLHRYKSQKFFIGNNTFDFSDDNYIIPIGSIIAFRNSNTYYFTLTSDGIYHGFQVDSNLLNVQNGSFMDSKIALKYQIYFNDIVYVPIKSSLLKKDIEELQESSVDSFDYVLIYNKKFSDKEEWNDIGVDSTYTAWESDGEAIYPTSKGGYHTDIKNDNLMKAGIGLWNIYSADKKFCVFDVSLYSDTILNLHFFRDVSTGMRPNESTYRINCADSQLEALRLDGRTVTDEVLRYSQIKTPIVDGRRYRVIAKKDDVTFSMELWDLTTGEQIANLVFGGNWDCGTQQWNYGFSWKDGVNPPKIYNFAVYEPNEPFCIYSGNSITEGTGMQNDPKNRYAELARKASKNSVICAAGSAVINDVLNMFESEFSKTKPKNLCITIGTNNASTEESLLSKYQEIKQKADEIGTNLILNHIPIMVGNPTGCVRRNNEIAQIGVDSCRFDLATSINNDPSQGGNSALYTDGTHPNYGGSIAMFDRMKLDVPYLFRH